MWLFFAALYLVCALALLPIVVVLRITHRRDSYLGLLIDRLMANLRDLLSWSSESWTRR